ncbi:hypothetical protein [Hymenobacter cellulosivorans]|uniref:Uncharacterized protein n=1 Tax=Hymenobacter cellulosivorans TaxID=2932249 RepID=A0ABY4F2L0_9BACT|nr:hypothetical protein [Hymenobacter cellulosivorans]UOQ50719.1 hypothetical protein MUN80_13215 [Hymenobacter cellulosivorans]
MTSSHLTERDLQEAAESFSRLPAPQAAHLQGCPLCQGRVATYQRLFTAASHLPQPAFAFDLTASVLAQLPQPKLTFPWVLVLVATLVLGVISVFLLLFGAALLPIFQVVSTGLGAGLMAVAGFLVAGQCLELLARHRRRMSLLALS